MSKPKTRKKKTTRRRLIKGGTSLLAPATKPEKAIETCPPMSEIVGIDPPPTLITPTQAMEWIEHRGHNRKVDQAFVDSLVRDIQAQQWDVNGATIVFDTEDRLIDGQHRLWAIFLSGVPCYCHIVRGVHPDAIKNIDACRARSSADQLDILRLVDKNAKTVDGILRTLLAEERAIGTFDFHSTNEKFSNREILEVLERHPAVAEAATRTHMRPQLIGRAMLGFFYYKFSRINREKADSWLEAFKTGENLPKNSPMYKLRERFIENSISRGEKLTRRAKAALIIKSWNLHVQNKPCGRLVWQANEQFPKMRRRA